VQVFLLLKVGYYWVADCGSQVVDQPQAAGTLGA
jgi:hypothetical protein